MKRFVPLVIVLLIGTATATVSAQGRGFQGGRGQGGHGGGRGGHGRGPDANFAADRDDFHFLLENHDKVRRTVKELPQGVETVTESDTPEIAAKIQKHVRAMYQRIENQRPIRMRDPLFAEIFRHTEKIKMEFTKTDKGVRVVETSDDPYVASLIQAHAKVVSRFVKLGFEEAHKTHAIPGKPQTGGGAMHSHEEMKDMVFVEFDRIYIPALALTNQKKPEAAHALARLSKSWETHLVGHFHELFPQDSQWPRDLSQIAQCIALAQAKLESGETLESHEALEPIRDLLLAARRRNEVAYPLDTLSQFHATMESIVKPAMGLNAESLEPQQLEALRKLSKQADQEWQLVERAEFDFTMLGKTEAQQNAFPGMLKAEREAIQQLQDDLAKNDKASILKSARGLKPPFAKAYMFFGDFPQPSESKEHERAISPANPR